MKYLYQTVIAMFIMTSVATADDGVPIYIDLTQGNVTAQIPTSNIGKELTFTLKNKVPGAVYSYEYRLYADTVNTLPGNVFTTEKQPAAAPETDKNSQNNRDEKKFLDGDDCGKLKKALDTLASSTSEQEVKNRLAAVKVQYEVIKLKQGKTAGEVTTPVDGADLCLAYHGKASIQAVENTTNLALTTMQLSRGEKITFNINRKDGGPSWQHTYTTGSRGAWSPTWGFAMFESQSESYYSAPDGGGAFTVKKGTSRADIEMTPVVMFSWMHNEKSNKSWDYSMTAGLGLDLTNPTILLGANATYNQNITVSAGMAARQYAALKSRYNEDQTIPDAIDSADLVENVYKGTPFLSVTYRFGSNPF